jgi:hypothetical protein
MHAPVVTARQFGGPGTFRKRRQFRQVTARRDARNGSRIDRAC